MCSLLCCSLCTHIFMEKMESSAIPLFEEVDFEKLSNECQQQLPTLLREKTWDGSYYHLYQGFWFRAILLHGSILFQKHFQAEDEDVLVITAAKSGTTWLKALTLPLPTEKIPHSLRALCSLAALINWYVSLNLTFIIWNRSIPISMTFLALDSLPPTYHINCCRRPLKILSVGLCICVEIQ